MTRKGAGNAERADKYILVFKLTVIYSTTIYQVPIVYVPLFSAVVRTRQALALKELRF